VCITSTTACQVTEAKEWGLGFDARVEGGPHYDGRFISLASGRDKRGGSDRVAIS
jgi:hypothetical protein